MALEILNVGLKYLTSSFHGTRILLITEELQPVDEGANSFDAKLPNSLFKTISSECWVVCMDETCEDAIAIHGDDRVSNNGQARPSAQNSQAGSVTDAQGDQLFHMETIGRLCPTYDFHPFHSLLKVQLFCISAQSIIVGGCCQ